MRVIIDRFEGDLAVCEKTDGHTIHIEKRLLPPDAAEGDALIVAKSRITVDKIETEKRKQRILEKTKDLWA